MAIMPQSKEKEVIWLALTAEQIQELMGKSRTKGLYLGRLNEFLSSDNAGVCAQEEWPTDFGEKTDTTVKQGFENAKNSKNAGTGADGVRVINNDSKTYLIKSAAPVDAAPVAPDPNAEI